MGIWLLVLSAWPLKSTKAVEAFTAVEVPEYDTLSSQS